MGSETECAGCGAAPPRPGERCAHCGTVAAVLPPKSKRGKNRHTKAFLGGQVRNARHLLLIAALFTGLASWAALVGQPERPPPPSMFDPFPSPPSPEVLRDIARRNEIQHELGVAWAPLAVALGVSWWWSRKNLLTAVKLAQAALLVTAVTMAVLDVAMVRLAARLLVPMFFYLMVCAVAAVRLKRLEQLDAQPTVSSAPPRSPPGLIS